MTAKSLLEYNLGMTDMVVNAYLGDLTDADMLLRAVPGMNHIAWQLGHLILSENRFLTMVKPGSAPPLPEGFDAQYSKETATVDDATKFHTKAQLMDLYNQHREATKKLIAESTDADLERTGPEFPEYAPSAGAALTLCANHPMMHAGQWVAVRRTLGKPVTI
jgi:uncharacterized damage-inducible protein DinB